LDYPALQAGPSLEGVSKGHFSLFIPSVCPSHFFPAGRLFAKIAHRAIFSRSALLKGRCKILTFKYIIIKEVPL
jgi:hypothetical protein